MDCSPLLRAALGPFGLRQMFASASCLPGPASAGMTESRAVCSERSFATARALVRVLARQR